MPGRRAGGGVASETPTRTAPAPRYPAPASRLMRPVPSVRLALVALLALSVSGCRPGSALHGRYNNFRAYYNTFYNAERALEDGERTLEQAAVSVDRNQLVAVFPVTGGSGGSGGQFQEAIDKSAELLRGRPDSKWADDALLVIGKAYFYQRNFAGAEQKFLETTAAAEQIDDRVLADQARFWLGRTYAAQDRFDEGVTVLEDGLARDGVDRRWAGRMRLALGELYARAGRWDEAAEALRLGAPEESDADVAARAYVLLGQVEEHADRFDLAADAYAEALDRRPAYELAFAAELSRALVLGLDGGQPDPALAVVRAMRADDKHYPRRAELALAEGRLRAAAGQPDAALGLYRSVLYDPEMNGATVRGPAHYRLGEFYRDVLGDYVRASAHLDTAATALRGGDGDVRATRDAILDVTDEARTYGGLAASARRIAEVDSLMALGALSDGDFRARIASVEAERRRVYVEEQRRLQSERTAAAFRGGGAPSAFGSEADAPATDAGAGAPEATRRGQGNAQGFLSVGDPASLQAGRVAFEQRWGARPLVPSWRRRASIQAGAIASDRGVVPDGIDGGFGFGEGPPPLDLSAIPRTPAKRAAMVTELAGLRYELANAFFLSLGRADTASALYRTILEETPDLPVATRARYALAELERAAGRDDVARPLYRAVADADSAALGRASRERLGEAPIEAAPVVTDETPAAYDAARRQWEGGDPLGAAAALVALGDIDARRPAGAARLPRRRRRVCRVGPPTRSHWRRRCPTRSSRRCSRRWARPSRPRTRPRTSRPSLSPPRPPTPRPPTPRPPSRETPARPPGSPVPRPRPWSATPAAPFPTPRRRRPPGRSRTRPRSGRASGANSGPSRPGSPCPSAAGARCASLTRRRRPSSRRPTRPGSPSARTSSGSPSATPTRPTPTARSRWRRRSPRPSCPPTPPARRRTRSPRRPPPSPPTGPRPRRPSPCRASAGPRRWRPRPAGSPGGSRRCRSPTRAAR